MIRHDFLCPKCGAISEITFFSVSDFRREWPCGNCGGMARQVWLRAPGLAGVEEPSTRGVRRTFQPGHDVQSGQYFNSRAERDRWLKKRGLEALGPEEYDRSRKAAKEDPEPDYSDLMPTIKDAYEEVQAGKHTGPPTAILDTNKDPIMGGNDA